MKVNVRLTQGPQSVASTVMTIANSGRTISRKPDQSLPKPRALDARCCTHFHCWRSCKTRLGAFVDLLGKLTEAAGHH